MNFFPQKFRTLARLLLRGDRSKLADRLRYNWLLLRVGISRGQPFVYRQAGVRYLCHPDNSDSMIVAAAASTDQLEIALLRRWLQPGDLFLDGGANLGTYALAAAQFVGVGGRVVAVDAGHAILNVLADAARRLNHSHLHCVHAALGDHNGEVRFFEGRQEGTSFIQSLRPVQTGAAAFAERKVNMLTLCSLAEQHLPFSPSAVKLDIEGAEGDALSAAPTQWLEADGPLWIVEINPEALRLFEQTPQKLVARFPDAAFAKWILPKELRRTDGRGDLRPLGPAEAWLDSKYYNLIAIPRGAVREARTRRLRPVLP